MSESSREVTNQPTDRPTDRPTLIYGVRIAHRHVTDTRAVRVKYASGTALSVFITSSRWGVLIDNGGEVSCTVAAAAAVATAAKIARSGFKVAQERVPLFFHVVSSCPALSPPLGALPLW